MSYVFDPDGSDHVYTKLLYESMESENKSHVELARFGLRASNDEMFRSVCVEYLADIGFLSEKDLLIALADPDEVVRAEAVTASVDIDSLEIRKQLTSMIESEEDDFYIAWIIATLGLKEHEAFEIVYRTKSEWLSSEIVQCSVTFYCAYMKQEEYEILRFFQYINSDSHLVRGMVGNLSDCFAGTAFSNKIEAILASRLVKEDWASVKELLEQKIAVLQ